LFGQVSQFNYFMSLTSNFSLVASQRCSWNRTKTSLLQFTTAKNKLSTSVNCWTEFNSWKVHWLWSLETKPEMCVIFKLVP
jgi:hypothetical protein